ncbi:MAG TPA: sulfur transferase domain-containing protein [Gammaproteobacteria bacterium]|jgi:uncharacterized protein (TIGR01244 family)
MPAEQRRMTPGALKNPVLWLFLLAGFPAIGGAQLLNEAEPLPGIVTAGQPDAAELAELAEKGFVTVIDLRGEGEDRGFAEPAVVEDLGMSYISLPISGGESITYENAAALDAILNAADGPVLLHCASGNRAGALLSLRQRLIGDDAETALGIGLAGGLSSPALREIVESRLDER